MNKSLPRRTFLRGLGTSLAVPFLDAMVPALSAACQLARTPTQRLGFVYVPNGVNWHKWTPEGIGDQFKFSPTLTPLEPFRKQLVIVSQLSSQPAEAQGNGSGDHARACAAWLTGVHPKKTEGADIHAGKTADHYAADALGGDTQFPSLQLAVDDIGLVGNCDGGYACPYQNTLSWRTPTTPVPMQTNPRVVFERLFGVAATPQERRTMARAQRSILDSITQEVARFHSTLGGGDRARLQEYLEGIREFEVRIAKAEKQTVEVNLSTATLPVGIPDMFDEHVKMMFDLQLLAFQADLTRVTTFMMSREATQRTYAQIGVPDAHHGLSHHSDNPDLLEKLAKIDRYHVDLFAYFVGKLAETPDGDGSLLDNTILMYGSGIRNGMTHSHRDLPTLVVGGGAGKLKGGQHVVAAPDTPLTNLQLTLLQKVGVPVEQFGDSTGTLAVL